MMISTESAPVPSREPGSLADQLRLTATAYLARFKGSSREHTESDLRCYLTWCAERSLDGDTERQHQEAQVLHTGLFYSAARFRIIEGSPEPAEWLEVFETDDPDPLHAYSRTVSNTPPAPQIQPELSQSFRWLAPANEGRVS